MVTLSGNIWSVQLAPSHQPYQVCQFKRELENNPGWTVVIVDTHRFMECYHREMKCYVIPTVDEWKGEKKEGIRNFLDPSTGAPHMPRVGFNTRIQKRLFGLMKSQIVGVVSFVNGRHRARYLQFAGAKCFPVEVQKGDAPSLVKYCGCQCEPP